MSDPLLKNHADMMLAVEAGYDYAPNIAQDMADRIKELQAQVGGLLRQASDSHDALCRAEAAEAKLAKAVGALHEIAGKKVYANDPWGIARTTLAELKGQDDGDS